MSDRVGFHGRPWRLRTRHSTSLELANHLAKSLGAVLTQYRGVPHLTAPCLTGLELSYLVPPLGPSATSTQVPTLVLASCDSLQAPNGLHEQVRCFAFYLTTLFPTNPLPLWLTSYNGCRSSSGEQPWLQLASIHTHHGQPSSHQCQNLERLPSTTSVYRLGRAFATKDGRTNQALMVSSLFGTRLCPGVQASSLHWSALWCLGGTRPGGGPQDTSGTTELTGRPTAICRTCRRPPTKPDPQPYRPSCSTKLLQCPAWDAAPTQWYRYSLWAPPSWIQPLLSSNSALTHVLKCGGLGTAQPSLVPWKENLSCR